MNRILMFLFGSICFRAQGGFPERFLNLCHLKGVKLYSLTERDGVLCAETSLASFRKIRRCASGSGMRIKIEQKKGFPFVYRHFAKRTGLFIGIALAAFLLFFYSRSVWHIQISGNETIANERILQVLEQNGVREGVFKKDIEDKKLTFALYEAIPDIAWLNIGVDGSRLTVNLRERVQKPENKDEKEYCNIIAAKDGVVDKITVFEGERVVEEGYGVHEGQLLVSGVIYHEQAKKNTFHHSRAEVFASTKAEKSIRIPKRYQKTSFTGRQKRLKVLHIFRLRLPLYLFTDSFAQREVSLIRHPLVIKGVQLPVGIEEYLLKEVKTERCKADLHTARALARAQKTAFEHSFRERTKIVSVKEEVQEQADAYIFRYRYELYENIAKSAPLQIHRQKSK